jgi:formylglycine-generating enzyme
MSDFDPYHIWLEIPPDEQPPTPHRLLGIAPDETDKETIREAALQRNAFIRQFSLGEQGIIAERLLNEIAAARDNILAGNVQTAVETPLAVETPIEPVVEKTDPSTATPVSPILVADREPLAQQETQSIAAEWSTFQPAKRPRRRKPKEIWKRPAVIGVSVVGVIGVFVLVISLMFSGDADPVVSNTAGRISAEMAVEKADAEKVAAVSAALDKGDWKAVLSLSPNNSEGLRMKAVADKAAMDKAAMDKAAMDKAAMDKAAMDKAAMDKAAIDKAAMDKAAMDKAAMDKAAMDKAAMDKAAMDKAAMDKAAMEKAAILAGDPITNTIGMTLNKIPAGTFTMGSSKGQRIPSGQVPQHPVTISKPFYMQTTEVTQGQWKEVMGTEPWKSKPSVKEGPNYAASHVSWDDAVAYCKTLSGKENKTYRLPTEAEWEYACRAGTQTKFSFGDDEKILGDYAWYRENAWDIDEKYAHQVRQKKPNAFGLYDMYGNVLEWCHDYYDEDYYKQSPAQDPPGPTSGSGRVLRGGSWDWRYVTRSYRSANRFWLGADARFNYVGFRLVRELDDSTQSTTPPEHLNQPFALLEFPGNPKMASIAVGTPIHSNRDYVWAKVPLELVGLQATMWEGHQGRADVNIISPGWVVMATSTRWGGGGGGGDWEQELTTKQQLLDDGWVKITRVEQKTDDPNDPLSWSVFTKEYQGGEQIRLRTEKYLAPVFFFPPRR